MSEEPNEELWSDLYSYVEYLQQQRHSAYADPETAEEERLRQALGHVAEQALKLLYHPTELERVLQRDLIAQPWEDIRPAVNRLLSYNIVHDALEASAAMEVVGRLEGLSNRIRVAVLAFTFLQASQPSDTALKYFRQVVRSYLAGFYAEATIMCGATLEAAIRSRVTDDLLKEKGIRPRHPKAALYSIGQRMKVEEELDILDPEDREQFWWIVNQRNDAVHVQPDLSPEPDAILFQTAWLLGRINPVDPAK